jgi:hypothetical protein
MGESMGDALEEKKERTQVSDAQRIEATLWRLLRAIYLRVEARHLRRAPLDLSDEEANAALDPWFAAMQSDLEILKECIRMAQDKGTSDAFARLHASHVQEVDGHELLDQVLVDPFIEESPGMQHPRHGSL